MGEDIASIRDAVKEIEKRIERYIKGTMEALGAKMDYMRAWGWHNEEELLKVIRSCENIEPPLPAEFNAGYIKGLEESAGIVRMTAEPEAAENSALWIEEHKCEFLEEAETSEEALKSAAADTFAREPFYSAGYVCALRRAAKIASSLF